jgi:excinuclease ABC subunit C
MELKDTIKNIPHKSGVYIMKNSAQEILYIGKAKDLNKRVSSYFQKKTSDLKTESLLLSVSSIETILTDNEIEALILESNLIKKHRPRFNIELKDNNKYPYIKISNEKYPRILKTRIKKDDAALYFGPYPNVKYINRTIKTITDIFPIRRCNRKLDAGKSRTGAPCINYYLKKCICPFIGTISEEEYKKLVEQVVFFLKGQNNQLLTRIKKEMVDEANSQRFEKAIQLRDRFVALTTLLKDQKMATKSGENEDIFGIAHINDTFSITVLIKRRGGIIGKRDSIVRNSAGEREALESYLPLFYDECSDPPKSVLLPFDISEKKTIIDYLKRKYEKPISIVIPQKGLKKRLVDLAGRNAFKQIEEHMYQYNPSHALEALQSLLRLGKKPQCVEGFDVATTLGDFSVASMVRFVNGMPDKNNYRRYRIKYVEDQNDVEMMKEAVARRYQRLLNEKKPAPDLILVDGGKPQVNAAAKIIHALGIEDVPIIGLAKKNEDIYTLGRKAPLRLQENHDALRLLMAIRNEAHRFANAYHVRIRGREAIESKLKEIPGIGDTLAATILGSIQTSRGELTVKELAKIRGIGRKKAQDIFELLQGEQGGEKKKNI